jgi:putative DNA primase/helicase
VSNSDETEIARLATLPPLEYERQREAAASRMGCRTSILDKLVESKRPRTAQAEAELQGRTLNLPDVEPWPDAVTGANVLTEVADTFARYVALPHGAAEALALWCAHTHCFDGFTCTPRLHVTSPDKGCGKSTLRDVLATFVPRPMPTENLSAAVLFRVTQRHRPTLLADECDRYLQDNDELLAMLNAGHRRGGQALRCEGDNHEVRAFNVFAPAVLCGIGALPGTLHDRSIVIRLQRAKPGELRERFDVRRTDREKGLCRKLARFVADYRARIEACEPSVPGAFNRVADNWRPLFAVAQVAGGDWPERAADAFAKLTVTDDLDAQGVGTMLLVDIAAIFAAAGVDKLPSAKLAASLAEIEGRPWAEWGRSRKPISPNQLANQLRRFGVSPHAIRVGNETPRGYALADFQEPFDRFLPQTGFPECNSATTLENIGDSRLSEPQHPKSVLHPENAVSANKDGACCGVALREPVAVGMDNADLL